MYFDGLQSWQAATAFRLERRCALGSRIEGFAPAMLKPFGPVEQVD